MLSFRNLACFTNVKPLGDEIYMVGRSSLMSPRGLGSNGEVERSMKSFPLVLFPPDVHVGMAEHLGYRITMIQTLKKEDVNTMVVLPVSNNNPPYV